MWMIGKMTRSRNRSMSRPVLAVLRASDGSTAEVDRAVLIGRAPSAQRSSARAPRLMTVPSPGHDISRTHLEVAPEGWSVAVTDLHSTNGTILVRPGEADRQPGDHRDRSPAVEREHVVGCRAGRRHG